MDVKKLIINIIAKLTIGFKDKEDLLAKKIVQDLEQLKDYPNTDFVDNILAPLLKTEYKIHVSFGFKDPVDNSFLTFKSASEKWLESRKNINFFSRLGLTRVVNHWSKILDSTFNKSKTFSAKWQNI